MNKYLLEYKRGTEVCGLVVSTGFTLEEIKNYIEADFNKMLMFTLEEKGYKQILINVKEIVSIYDIL